MQKFILPWNKTHFLLSVARLNQLPTDQGKEIVFAGRSNAGKSSALNTITGIHGLARISKMPGCTQLLNFFQITEQVRLVDLPGYGYAKVPANVRARWEKLLENYLTKRQSLCGFVLVMDIRHPLTPFDDQMLEWAAHLRRPAHILLTKADKLSNNQAKQSLEQVKKELADAPIPISVQLFSALKKIGIEQAREQFCQWFSYP